MTIPSRESVARLGSDLRLGIRIGRAEFLKEWRRQVGSRRTLVVLGIFLLLAAPTALGTARTAYATGRMVASGPDVPMLALARNLLAPLLIVVGLLGGLSGAQRLGDNAGMPLLLTTVPARAIVVGQYLRDQGNQFLLIGLAMAVVGVPFLVGVGSPVMAVAVLLAVPPLVILATLLGQMAAYALWSALLALPVPAGFRQAFGAIVAGVAVVASVLGGAVAGYETGSGGLSLPTGPPLTPLGWYADLLFVGTPLVPSIPPQSVLAAVLVLGAIPVAGAISVKLAPRVWYATATGAADERDDTASRSTTANRRSFLGTPWPGSQSRTLRVAFAHVLRAVRRPGRFVYLLYYAYIPAMFLFPAFSDPSLVPESVSGALLLTGVFLAGGVFCLNPLGEEGSMLDELVLTETPAATFVHARLLVGTVVGLALSLTGLGVLVALTSVPVSDLPRGVVVVTAVVCASAALALGTGAFAPRFETTRVFNASEALTPSTLAGVVHGGVVLALSAGATAVFVLDTGDGWIARWGLLAAFLFVTALLADGSRRYAIHRMATHGKSRATSGTDPALAAYIALGLAVLAMVLSAAVTVSTIFAGAIQLPSRVLLVVTFVVSYVGFLAIAAGFLYVTERWPAYLDWSWPSRRDLGIVLGGLAASLLVWGAYITAVTRFDLPTSDHQAFESAAEVDPVAVLLLVVLALVVIGPVEELLFRNVIQRYLSEHLPVSAAIGFASLLFAFVHVPVYYDPTLVALAGPLAVVFVLSCLFGVIYARTGNLAVPALVHGLYDAVVFGAVFLVG